MSDILLEWLACKTLAEQKKFASEHNLPITFKDCDQTSSKTEDKNLKKGETINDNPTITK